MRSSVKRALRRLGIRKDDPLYGVYLRILEAAAEGQATEVPEWLVRDAIRRLRKSGKYGRRQKAYIPPSTAGYIASCRVAGLDPDPDLL